MLQEVLKRQDEMNQVRARHMAVEVGPVAPQPQPKPQPQPSPPTSNLRLEDYTPSQFRPPLVKTLLSDLDPADSIPLVLYYYSLRGLKFTDLQAYLEKLNVIVSKPAFHRFRHTHLGGKRRISIPDCQTIVDGVYSVVAKVSSLNVTL